MERSCCCCSYSLIFYPCLRVMLKCNDQGIMEVVWNFFLFPEALQYTVKGLEGIGTHCFVYLSRYAIFSHCFSWAGLEDGFLNLTDWLIGGVSRSSRTGCSETWLSAVGFTVEGLFCRLLKCSTQQSFVPFEDSRGEQPDIDWSYTSGSWRTFGCCDCPHSIWHIQLYLATTGPASFAVLSALSSGGS